MIKQTERRDNLGELTSEFAKLNDDVLFGETWNREDKLSLSNLKLVKSNLEDKEYTSIFDALSSMLNKVLEYSQENSYIRIFKEKLL